VPDKTASTATHLPSQARSSLWRDRDFLLLWSGGAASDLGSAVSVLLIPLMAVQSLGATTFQVAMLTMVRRLPPVLLALPAGAMVDRVRKRRLMIVCDVALALAVASVPVAALFGRVSLWQLYVVLAVVGCGTVFFGVADMSYLPSMLTRDQLVDANGKLNAAETAADVAGPALGALLAGAITAARAIAVDAVSYVVSAATMLLMRAPDPRPEPHQAAQLTVAFHEAMTVGIRYVWRDRALRAISCCAATANLGMSFVSSIEVVYLIREMQVSSTLVGVVIGIGVIGGFAGSVVARPLADRFGAVRVMWLSLLVCAPFALLLPLATRGAGIALYSLGWGVFNFGGVVHQTAQMAYRQTAVPRALLGRVNASIRWVVWSAIPVGVLLAGSVGTWLGLRTALWIGASLLSVTSLWLLASPLRRMRDIPQAPEAT
jgi:MFS family permease